MGIGPTSAAYMLPSGIKATPAVDSQRSSMETVHTVQNYTSAINPPLVTSTGYNRELSNLAKMYTEEAKYSGRNDSFIFKLAIFHDICSRTQVLPKAKMKALFTMLKGLALDYYYSNISTGGVAMNFDQVCYSIRNYFEGAEYKQSVLSKWNKLNLKSVISRNEGKPMEECLQQLIDKLQHLQHGLDPKLCTDRFIHNKLINACQNLLACQYACFKPADSLAGLINDLYSSIITYTQANPTSKAFFTDQQYHKYDRRFDNSRLNRTQPRTSDNRKKKKYFVCLKEGCWSSKHTKEERNKSRN